MTTFLTILVFIAAFDIVISLIVFSLCFLFFGTSEYKENLSWGDVFLISITWGSLWFIMLYGIIEGKIKKGKT